MPDLNASLKKLRSLSLAAIVGLAPIAAHAQVTDSGGPTPPAAALPPAAPSTGCIYLGNTFTLPANLQAKALTCGANGGLNVNVLTGGSSGGSVTAPGAVGSQAQTVTAVPGASTGTNYDANDGTLPVIGQPFPASGPYASYVLVKTIPAGARNNVEIKNSSGGNIVIMRDDGTAASGAAPVNASLIPLSPGAAAGQQGGAWSSVTFRGRLQIFAPVSSSQITAFVD